MAELRIHGKELSKFKSFLNACSKLDRKDGTIDISIGPSGINTVCGEGRFYTFRGEFQAPMFEKLTADRTVYIKNLFIKDFAALKSRRVNTVDMKTTNGCLTANYFDENMRFMYSVEACGG